MVFSERSRYNGTCTCVSPDGYIDVKVGCEGSEVVSTSPFSCVFVKCGRVTDYMFVEIYYRALKCVLAGLLNGFYCPVEGGLLPSGVFARFLIRYVLRRAVASVLVRRDGDVERAR